MKQRIITAVIFSLIMVLGIFGGGWSFSILILFIVVMSLVEFFRMIQYEGVGDIRLVLAIFLGLSPVLFAFAKKLSIPVDFSLENYAVMLVPFLFLFYLLELNRASSKAATNLANAFFGFVYIGIPYALLVVLAWWHGTYEPLLVLGLLLMVWLNDTGAYFTGSFFGKHKLAPSISPKKTWEGLIGGIAATLLTSQLLATYLPNYSRLDWLVMGLICSLGILGDLVESMFKRGAGIKDSGKLMPGHGGVLDRFDAFAFVIPLVFVYFYFFLGV